MNNFLFLVDKNCTMNPRVGKSSHHIHFISSFEKHQSDFNTHTLFYDEAAGIYGKHIDEVLVPYCRAFNINYCFICFNGNSPWNPSINSLKSLKELNIKLIVCYSDTNACDLNFQNQLKDIVDLQVSIDYPKKNGQDLIKENVLRLWTPQPEFLLYYPDIQDIEVSFVGSARYHDRMIYLANLKESIPDIFITGGQRETGMTFEKYASYIRRSKIGINFSKNPMQNSYEQLKGRVFEIIGSKSLLLEEKNSCSSDFFTPGEDYIEFENLNDLIDKIAYFRHNEKERLEIAENGYKKFKEKYTSRHFWREIMNKI